MIKLQGILKEVIGVEISIMSNISRDLLEINAELRGFLKDII